MRAIVSVLLLVVLIFPVAAQQPAPAAAHFKAGFAKRDITPEKPTPMWGYGARHALLSNGVMDPLYAKTVVIDTGDHKLAIMGLDMGRGPTEAMMGRIRAAVKETSGVDFLMISGSHTHHGPVIELLDEVGKGKGKYDDAVAYAKVLEARLIEAINEAAANAKDAKLGWGSAQVPFSRNRHTELEPKPVDHELSVLRLEDLEGKPIALVVNFGAHPTNISAMVLKFSSEYPGQMMNRVEEVTGSPCLFMQGAAGDQSSNTTQELDDYKKFGAAMGEEVVKIAKAIEPSVPASPSIEGVDESFEFRSRIDFANPLMLKLFAQAFFPELAGAVSVEINDVYLRPVMTTMLVNGELALVGASGEFFSAHSTRLKARSRMKKTLFFGYCNGHHMYFPTIEGAAEGGYGADATVSWVEVGGPERMLDRALFHLYDFEGKYDVKMPGAK